MIRYTRTVQENLRFLALEVYKQVEDTLKILEGEDGEVREKIQDREDYIDILKSLVVNQCFARLQDRESTDQRMVDQMRSIDIVANNLEHISDFLVNIVGQTQYLSSINFMQQYQYKPFFSEIFRAMELIDPSLYRQDINRALVICRAEFTLDDLFSEVFHVIMEELRFGRETENLVTTLFIFRYLERVGDALLNIGEAIISAVIGEKLKIHQYQALEESLRSSEMGISRKDLSFQAYSETRSGLRVGKVEEKGERRKAQRVIFKEGKLKKLVEEKEAIENWQRLFPGITPAVFGFHTFGDNGSLLLEYLGGETLQSIILNAEDEIISKALRTLKRTMGAVWEKTMKNDPVNPRFLKQLSERLDDVFKVHPQYRQKSKMEDGRDSFSLEKMLEQAIPLEEEINAPFSVFIHGDFNLDNIIYDPERDKLFFIDLHRSRYLDYVQDISIFLLSLFRLPVFESSERQAINRVIPVAFHFARNFALKHGDRFFEARLTLGVIRSLVTSTRFELNQRFAGVMFQKASLLLGKFLEHADKPWEHFHFPEEVLILEKPE